MFILLQKVRMLMVSLVVAGIGFTDIVASAGMVEDSAITLEVKKNIIAEKDMPANIEVVTKDGVVSLKGTVDTNLQAQRAVEIASGADKVVDVVDSELKVKGSNSVMTDAIITAKVKGKIFQLSTSNKISSGYDLHVETKNQVVHITGYVTSEADIDTVVATAKATKGVKSVNNSIKVK